MKRRKPANSRQPDVHCRLRPWQLSRQHQGVNLAKTIDMAALIKQLAVDAATSAAAVAGMVIKEMRRKSRRIFSATSSMLH